MYGIADEGTYECDRYLELAARIEWEEQGSVERRRLPESAGTLTVSAEPLRG